LHGKRRNGDLLSKTTMDIPSVIAVDETVITERNGTWD
jgi:hypothetical protein